MPDEIGGPSQSERDAVTKLLLHLSEQTLGLVSAFLPHCQRRQRSPQTLILRGLFDGGAQQPDGFGGPLLAKLDFCLEKNDVDGERSLKDFA